MRKLVFILSVVAGLAACSSSRQGTNATKSTSPSEQSVATGKTNTAASESSAAAETVVPATGAKDVKKQTRAVAEAEKARRAQGGE